MGRVRGRRTRINNNSKAAVDNAEVTIWATWTINTLYTRPTPKRQPLPETVLYNPTLQWFTIRIRITNVHERAVPADRVARMRVVAILFCCLFSDRVDRYMNKFTNEE